MAQLKDLHIEAKHWLYPSNLLSLLRFLLIIPGYLAIVRQQHLLVIALLVAVSLTDMLDGICARRLNQVTELGKLLDPLADKLAILAAIVGLVVSKQIPLWVIYPVVVRDIVILVGGYLILKRRPVVPPSNLWGKLMTSSVALVVLVYMLPLPGGVRWASFGLMLGLVIFSFVSYARVFVRFWRSPKS